MSEMMSEGNKTNIKNRNTIETSRIHERPYSESCQYHPPLMEILPTSLRDLGQLRHLEQACLPKDAWPCWI